MKRTTTRRKREMQHFVTDNRRLFPFALLFLVGVGLGVGAYLTAADGLPDRLLALTPVGEGAGGWFTAWGEACFSTAVLLGVLFLLGLWACGVPFILLVPLFHGVGLGLTEAYYYAAGMDGVAVVAALVMPVGLLSGAVLIAACAESLQLSLCLSRRLLPHGEEGGLWSRFRLYGLRFLLFFAAALTVALAEVLLRRLLL
ncbi:MAG: hypothetical protein IJN04_00380 [Clostridia bacterium]|nr:hypothetical protein [Clostridia bacterium]